ncbi:NAD-P-binding protein [Mycena floridula]|nr:NAD-P-binding protein [Mycena floridula]
MTSTPPTFSATNPLLGNAVNPHLPFSRPTTPGVPAQLGFVGIGAMGYLMARNLAKHRAHHGSSHSILIWNRSISKAEKLAKEVGEGIRVAHSLEQVARECDIIFTNLANDEVVRTVYETFAKTLTENSPARSKIFVETSTIYPTLAGELDAMISTIGRNAPGHPGVHLVTSPVFGTPTVADKAQLLIAMSGDYRSKKEVAHLLVPAVGRKVFDLGGNVEKAPTFKLIGNSMILGTVEIFAEAFTLADKSGIGADSINHLVQELFPAPGLMAYSNRMATDNFDGTTGFSIDGGIKDASHIRRLTAVHNSPMPAIDIAHQHLITARALHEKNKLQGKEVVETLDWSGLVAGTRVAAGLDGFDSTTHGVVKED